MTIQQSWDWLCSETSERVKIFALSPILWFFFPTKITHQNLRLWDLKLKTLYERERERGCWVKDPILTNLLDRFSLVRSHVCSKISQLNTGLVIMLYYFHWFWYFMWLILACTDVNPMGLLVWYNCCFRSGGWGRWAVHMLRLCSNFAFFIQDR